MDGSKVPITSSSQLWLPQQLQPWAMPVVRCKVGDVDVSVCRTLAAVESY